MKRQRNDHGTISESPNFFNTLTEEQYCKQLLSRSLIRLANNRPLCIDTILSILFINNSNDYVNTVYCNNDINNKLLQIFQNNNNIPPTTLTNNIPPTTLNNNNIPSLIDNITTDINKLMEIRNELEQIFKLKLQDINELNSNEFVNTLIQFINCRIHDIHNESLYDNDIENIISDNNNISELLQQVSNSTMESDFKIRLINKIKYRLYRNSLIEYYQKGFDIIKNSKGSPSNSGTAPSTNDIKSDNPLTFPISLIKDDIKKYTSNETSSLEYVIFNSEYNIKNSNNTLVTPLSCNFVKIGYYWTKYNKTHYDSENLPPKIVTGYRFNIYFPEYQSIIKQYYKNTNTNKSINIKTPTYFKVDLPADDTTDTLESSVESNVEYELIKFCCRPYYNDIAFKIEKKEWEMQIKRGFCCVFENDILKLDFSFKRMKYKR